MKLLSSLFRKSILRKIFNVFPVDPGRKLNVHKTFRRRPGRLLNVLCTFNLRPVSTGFMSGIIGRKYNFGYKKRQVRRFLRFCSQKLRKCYCRNAAVSRDSCTSFLSLLKWVVLKTILWIIAAAFIFMRCEECLEMIFQYVFAKIRYFKTCLGEPQMSRFDSFYINVVDSIDYPGQIIIQIFSQNQFFKVFDVL